MSRQLDTSRKGSAHNGLAGAFEQKLTVSSSRIHLKPGLSFDQLDTIALTISNNEAAKQMNEAKRKLFVIIQLKNWKKCLT
ncbi:MAG: hypothetical protein KZQ62_04445, partial [Candidatus Thiodiazotropha sp. (ex Lucinoma aequizonata)]|nr:hypothetical protein [Candidatus Thiodiazotropha sp. (ex Lucinoma aequizonata)]